MNNNGPTVVLNALLGYVEALKWIDQPKGKLCLFISSTFTDTHAERDILLQDILPRLQAKALPFGVSVMFSDMRFGVKDENTKEHDTWEVCAREIQRCHEESDGAFLLSLQGDKYGYQPLPKHLSISAFQDKLADPAVAQADKELLQAWYALDENCLPAALYTLKLLPDDKGEQMKYWRVVLPTLVNVLADVVFAQTVGEVPTDLLVKRSVTEWEAKYALDLQPAGRFLHFHRTLEGSFDGHPDLCDVLGKPEDEKKLVDLLAHMRSFHPTVSIIDCRPLSGQHCVSGVRGLPRIRELSQHERYLFAALGTVPVESYVNKDAHYDAYLAEWKTKATDLLDNELSFVLSKTEMWNRTGLGCNISGRILDEILHHVRFQAGRCSQFHGRRNLLQEALEKAVRSDRYGIMTGMYSAVALCVVGVSGSGKTSLMSMISSELRTSPVSCTIPVIIRFCGTSGMSCDGFALVRSLIWQIQHIYRLPQDSRTWPSFHKYDDAVSQLHYLLAQHPVILLIDSLDQLSNQYEEYSRISFLKDCKPHNDSIIILSTVPDVRDDMNNILFQADSVFELHNICRVIVPLLEIDDQAAESVVKDMVDKLLSSKGRKLHCESQWQALLQAIQVEPSVLYLTFACTIVERWKSFDTVFDLVATVKGIIQAVFARIAMVFGTKLVDHIVGFLTFSKSGVSDSEMLDLLSLCDDVLDEVFQYSELTTVRRIPVHVWLRVRQELSPFLVEKTSGTWSWYHRQLWEATESRYSNHAQRKFHCYLGQYFANIVPVDIRASRIIMSQDIILSSASQPVTAFQQSNSSAVWWEDSVVNVRRCTEALFHLVHAEMYDEAVKESCDVCNICAYIRAGQGYEVLDLLALLHKVREISSYFKWLQLNISALMMDPFQQFVLSALEQPLQSVVRQAMAVQVIPNGNSAWSCSRIGDWDSFYSTHLIVNLCGHTSAVMSVCAAGDSSSVVSGSADGTIKIWQVLTGRCNTTLRGHTALVSAVRISADGRTIVSGSNDGSVKIWNAQSGLCLRSLEGPVGEVWSVCLSSDCTTVCSATKGIEGAAVRVWNVSSGNCLNVLVGDGGKNYVASSVCIFSDGSITLSAMFRQSSEADDEFGTIALWDTFTGECLKSFIPNGRVRELSLSCDDSKLVSVSDNGFQVWCVKSGVCLLSNRHVYYTVCFSPDATCFVTGNYDAVEVWDTASGLRLYDLVGHTAQIQTVCFSPDGKIIISGDCDSAIKVWDVAFDSSSQHAQAEEQNSAIIGTLCFAPDECSIISATNRTVNIWNILLGNQLMTVLEDEEHYIGGLEALCVSPNGSYILTGGGCEWGEVGNDNTVNIWEIASRKCLARLRGHTDSVVNVVFSPDCSKIVSESKDLDVKLWDVLSHECLSTIEIGSIVDRVFTDINTIVMLVREGEFDTCTIAVKSWDMRTESCQYLPVRAKAKNGRFAANGIVVCTGYTDAILIWDLPSNSIKMELEGNANYVMSLCVSLDGTKFVSGHYGKTMKLWDVATGACLSTFQHDGPVEKVCISPSGKKIATVTSDGSFSKRKPFIRMFEIHQYI